MGSDGRKPCLRRLRRQRGERREVMSRCIRSLQPFSAYADGQPLWTRLGVLMGVVFGAAMAAVAYWLGRDEAPAFALGGGVVGLGFPLLLRRSFRPMTRAVYDGKPPFLVETPSGDYAYRLPATWRISDRFAIGGVCSSARGAARSFPMRGISRGIGNRSSWFLVPRPEDTLERIRHAVAGKALDGVET